MDTSQHKQSHQITSRGGTAYKTGDIIAGKYKIIGLLGTGGMGTVYRVRQLLLNKDIALKMIDSTRVNDPVMIRRFQTEARATFSLDHCSLVKIHDFGVLNNNQPYIAMDLIEGVTLEEYIAQHGPLPIDLAVQIFTQACFGLSYAHQHSVIHRDIKPSNIMLANNSPLGREGSVKILDFGIAKIADAEGGEIQSLTRTGEVFGSPLYMSPEQCSGGLIDHRTDVYSLGCVLFEALTGTPPFVGINALRTMMLHQSQELPTLKEAALGNEFPEHLEKIVAKMLAKAPANRYDDLGVVAHELSQPGSGTYSAIAADLKAPTLQTKSKVKFTRFQHALIILSACAISSAFTRVFDLRLKPQSSATPPNEAAAPPAGLNNYSQGIDLDVQEKALVDHAKRAFKKCKIITSKEVPIDGVKRRLFTFPEAPIGSICLTSAPTQTVRAFGNVSEPIGAPIQLVIDEAFDYSVLVNWFIFDKIAKDEFDSIVLRRYGASIAMTDSRGVEPAAISHILKACSKWTRLKSLSLRLFTLADGDLDEINRMPYLSTLGLEKCELNEAKLAKEPFLRRVHTLILIDLSTGAPIRALDGSKILRWLILQNCKFSVSDFCALQQCPNIERLMLTSSSCTPEVIDQALKLRQVSALSICDGVLSRDQVKQLVKCTWLKSIHLNCKNQKILDSMGISDSRIKVDD